MSWSSGWSGAGWSGDMPLPSGGGGTAALASSDVIEIDDTGTLTAPAVFRSSDTVEIDDTGALVADAVFASSDVIEIDDSGVLTVSAGPPTYTTIYFSRIVGSGYRLNNMARSLGSIPSRLGIQIAGTRVTLSLNNKADDTPFAPTFVGGTITIGNAIAVLSPVVGILGVFTGTLSEIPQSVCEVVISIQTGPLPGAVYRTDPFVIDVQP